MVEKIIRNIETMKQIGMNVTVLVENTAPNGLISEHGLSLLIEYDGRRILLDSGSSEAFYENAAKMGVEFNHLDACVLSHGHYDHSGGFAVIFQSDPELGVYMQRSAMGEYFSGASELHDISVPKNVSLWWERFLWVDGFCEILPRVFLVPHSTKGLERIGEKAKLYKKVEGQILPDDFAHEQSLVYDTPNGLVIFNSCSHGGVGNIIREAKKSCQNRHVYAYVGGLHMLGKKNGVETCTFSDEELDELCAAILQEDISCIYTGHCTGSVGYEKLHMRLDDRVHRLTTGLCFTL